MTQTMVDSSRPPYISGIRGRVDPDLFSRTTIFADVPRDVAGRMVPLSEIVTVETNGVICRQGETANRLHLLLDGQVTLSSQASNGTSAVVEVLRPGGHFVLSTLLGNLPYLMTAHASAPSRLIAVDGAGLLALLPTEPVLAQAIMLAGAMEFRAMVRQVCDLKLRTTAQRLGCYLLELSHGNPSNTVSLRLPFDKRLLAARLGCRQENLSRAFAALRELGVETHGSRVTLHDVQKLCDYAGPDDPEVAIVGPGFTPFAAS